MKFPLWATSPSSNIDKKILQNLILKTNLETIEIVLKLFFKEIENFQMTSLNMVKDNDSKELLAIIHRLKSSSAIIGANEFSNLCQQVEIAYPDWVQINILVDKINIVIEGLMRDLKDFANFSNH